MTAYVFSGYVAVCCDGVGCTLGVRVQGTKSVRTARRYATTSGYRYLKGQDWCPGHQPADSGEGDR